MIVIRLLLRIILLFFIAACSEKSEKNEHICNSDKIVKVKYHIEDIGYWDIPNTDNDSIPCVELRVDTLNYIGSSIGYTETGKIMERIVIVDKNKAIKLDYANDTIVSMTLCRYKLRRDHPIYENYSIVVYK